LNYLGGKAGRGLEEKPEEKIELGALRQHEAKTLKNPKVPKEGERKSADPFVLRSL